MMWVNGNNLRGPGGRLSYIPAPFRPSGRPPVKGGRWSVRRLEGSRERPWRAYTSGNARGFSRGFQTQAEAFAYAEFVAKAWAEAKRIKGADPKRYVRGRLIQKFNR